MKATAVVGTRGEGGRYAKLANIAGPCDFRCLRRDLRSARVLPGVPGNSGAADGLHARRVPALRRPDTGRQPDCGMLAAEHAATERPVPGRVRFKRQCGFAKSAAAWLAAAVRAKTAGSLVDVNACIRWSWSGTSGRAQRQRLLMNRAVIGRAGAIIAEAAHMIRLFRARRQRPQKNFGQSIKLTTLAFA
jgi:hypothetical protein